MDEKLKKLFKKSPAFKKFADFLVTKGYTYELVGTLEKEIDTERDSSEGGLLPRSLAFWKYPADVKIFKGGKEVAYVKMAFRAGYDYKKGKEEGTIPYYEYEKLYKVGKLSGESIDNTKLELEFVYFIRDDYTSNKYGKEYAINKEYGYYKNVRGKAKMLKKKGYALTFNAATEMLEELESGSTDYYYDFSIAS